MRTTIILSQMLGIVGDAQDLLSQVVIGLENLSKYRAFMEELNHTKSHLMKAVNLVEDVKENIEIMIERGIK
ncbi:MAG: hypothetical protein ACRYE9_02215 [Janthinobacterium lividum]